MSKCSTPAPAAPRRPFVEKKIGDVLIAWENEALLTTRDSKDYEIVYPKQSILAEPSVAVVDKNVDKKKTRQAATEFLNYLYDPAMTRRSRT